MSMWVGRKLLLGNCSMRYPTTVRPVHMHCPTTVHPTHMDVGSVENARSNFQPWTYAFFAMSQGWRCDYWILNIKKVSSRRRRDLKV